MRFQLHHLLAGVTIFAVLLAFTKATGHADRDGIWEVVSIEREERVFTSFDGMGPPLDDYIGHLKDGDRKIRVRLSSSWLTDFEALPKPGEHVELKQTTLNLPTLNNRRSWILSRRTPILPRLLSVLVIAGISAALVFVSVVLQNQIVRFAIRKTGTDFVPVEPSLARRMRAERFGR